MQYRLTSLPAEIGRLTSLTGLYLGGNKLTSLPAEIGRLTSLTMLDLDGIYEGVYENLIQF